MTTEAPPTTTNVKAERKRGLREGSRHFELLRAKWPKAFPAKAHEVRPLTNSAERTITEEFGWPHGYAHGVLAVWKRRESYCKAVLLYPKRISLDGSPTDEEVSDDARAQATAGLKEHAARHERERAKAEADKARAAAKAPEPVAPPIPEPLPEPSAPAPEPQEPAKPRKLILGGSAAMQAALARRLASGPATTEVLKTVPAPSPGRKRAR